MNCRRLIPFLAVFLAFAQQLHAQVKVDMTISRRLYLVYEPIIATVAPDIWLRVGAEDPDGSAGSAACPDGAGRPFPAASACG